MKFSIFNKKGAEGFTLIELLVVVAIIAILSTSVLVSLNSARSKARDARVKSEMQQLKSAMELFYNNHDGYNTTSQAVTASGDACKSTSTGTFGADDFGNGPLAIMTSIVDVSTDEVCTAGNDTWAFSVTLPGGGAWCVDSNGRSIDGTVTAIAEPFTCVATPTTP